MGSQAHYQAFVGSPERVFDAAIQAIAQLGYRVIGVDEAKGELSFNSGRSWRTWAGQDVTVMIVDRGDGSTHVVLDGSTASLNNRWYTGEGQTYSYGEKAIVAKRFLGMLAEVLATTPEPDRRVTSVAGIGNADLVRQLGELAKLRDDGVITAQEFQSAKAKLLA